MRNYYALLLDLIWVACSAIVAVWIRDNFVFNEPHLRAVVAYAAVGVSTSTVVFLIAGPHRRLWEYTSLPDVLRIMAAVTVALLLAVFISFVVSRLEDVARSVPLIQWFLLVSAMIGTRVAVRLWHKRKRRDRLAHRDDFVQHVLLLGVSPLTELYLQSVSEYASKTTEIVGVLSDPKLRGRLLGFHKVLGTPEEVSKVIAELEVHGITLDRLVVTQPFEELSQLAAENLLKVEQGQRIRVDWMIELLGLKSVQPTMIERQSSPAAQPEELTNLPLGPYAHAKRICDVIAVICVGLLLAPLLVVVGALVAFDVGFPLVFWQKRPGRFGRPFRLFKFCTMRPAHDTTGVRIPDGERSSIVGRFLRRSRLDELPQLYNILIGEMSFVGPRPLLPLDQPLDTTLRQMVRPGLTGMAQVYGARDISPDDKNALDVWYVQHASLWLDIKILLKTPLVMLRGECVDQLHLHAARDGFQRLTGENLGAAHGASHDEVANEQASRALT